MIIGNGPSILDRPLGKVIDSFDTVIRLNRFSTKEVAHTGRKIDVWAVSKTFGTDTGKENFVDWKQRPKLLIKCGAKNSNNPILRGLAKKYKCKIEQYPEEYKAEIQKEIQALRPEEETRPSTGLFIVWYYLNYLNILKIYIHGFDHLQFGKRTHYFENRKYPKHKHIHVEEIERKYFNKWEKEKKVIRL